MRFLVGSISDWESLFTQAFNTLRPGGWLESYEGGSIISSDDGTVPENSALGQWGKIFSNFGETIGRPFLIVKEDIQMKAMQAAGFVDIGVRDLKVCMRADSPSISPLLYLFLVDSDSWRVESDWHLA